MVNWPNSPTGALLPKEGLQALGSTGKGKKTVSVRGKRKTGKIIGDRQAVRGSIGIQAGEGYSSRG